MAQPPKKGAFLGKLARFVSNPTTDWSSLDSAPPSQFLDAPELPEGTKFTQAEIMSMRHQRRKKNRSIRIKEFGMLRNVRAGKVIPGVAPDFNSAISEIAPTQPGDAKSIVASQIKSGNTRIGAGKGDFDINKINNIEQQMAEQWWDKASGSGAASDSPQIAEEAPAEVPKTQMLIEDNIGAQPVAQESDIIEIDPSFFDEETTPDVPAAPPVEPDLATVATVNPDSIPVDPAFFEETDTPQAPEPSVPQVLQPVAENAAPTHADIYDKEVEPEIPAAQATVTVEHAEKTEHEAEQKNAVQGAGEDVDTSEVDESEEFLHTIPIEETPELDDSVEDDIHLEMSDYLAASPQVHVEELPESLNEPAIWFAQDQDADVEAQLIEQSEALKEAVEKDPALEQQEPHPLLALLDYYRATKQEERFENASLYMVQLLGRSAPQYLAADLGQATRILTTVGSEFVVDGNQSNWSSSAELDLSDVMLLRSQLIGDPTQVLLDWRALEVILDEAVEPLVDQLRDLAQRKIELLMWGGEHLLTCCKQQLDAPQPPEKNVYALLWHLRLELVRIMHGQEVFEEESLEYCVALEESPPAWEAPKCFYIDADEATDILGETQATDADADDTQILESNTKHPMQWQGSMRGSIQKLLTALEAACEGQECIIDCLQLERIDSIATTELLAWLMAQTATTKRVQFINVNRLVAVFWRIMGLHMQADIELRRD